MDDSAFSAIKTLLDGDEKLLWSGRPLGGLRLRPQDVYLIPISLLWGGFAIVWEVVAIFGTMGAAMHHSQQGGSPPGFVFLFPLFGVPFLLMGLYFIFGRFFVDAWERDRTYYGVTDERVIIISGLFARQTKSLQLRTLSDVSMTEGSKGRGAITFGPANSLFAPFAMFSLGGWPGSRRFAPPAFELLENPREIYDIIRRAQKSVLSKT